jgi:hypothetical protein
MVCPMCDRIKAMLEGAQMQEFLNDPTGLREGHQNAQRQAQYKRDQNAMLMDPTAWAQLALDTKTGKAVKAKVKRKATKWNKYVKAQMPKMKSKHPRSSPKQNLKRVAKLWKSAKKKVR